MPVPNDSLLHRYVGDGLMAGGPFSPNTCSPLPPPPKMDPQKSCSVFALFLWSSTPPSKSP